MNTSFFVLKQPLTCPPYPVAPKLELGDVPVVDPTSCDNLAWDQVAKRTVQAVMAVDMLPCLQLLTRIQHRGELIDFQVLVTQASIDRLYQSMVRGFPGRAGSSFTRRRQAHSSNALGVNSVSLSTQMA
ncbi:hypothetical protein [Delftia acidovorans]|uniref:hypothetical protein n=1 Tax=Delftia acidovorans TaxID=80866 RepID=UPI0012FD8C52|nr:hypothetical protein [Delftia acidovorans]